MNSPDSADPWGDIGNLANSPQMDWEKLDLNWLREISDNEEPKDTPKKGKLSLVTDGNEEVSRNIQQLSTNELKSQQKSVTILLKLQNNGKDGTTATWLPLVGQVTTTTAITVVLSCFVTTLIVLSLVIVLFKRRKRKGHPSIQHQPSISMNSLNVFDKSVSENFIATDCHQAHLIANEESFVTSPFDTDFGFDFTKSLVNADGGYLSNSGGIDPLDTASHRGSMESDANDSGVSSGYLEHIPLDVSPSLERKKGAIVINDSLDEAEFAKLTVLPPDFNSSKFYTIERSSSNIRNKRGRNATLRDASAEEIDNTLDTNEFHNNYALYTATLPSFKKRGDKSRSYETDQGSQNSSIKDFHSSRKLLNRMDNDVAQIIAMNLTSNHNNCTKQKTQLSTFSKEDHSVRDSDGRVIYNERTAL